MEMRTFKRIAAAPMARLLSGLVTILALGAAPSAQALTVEFLGWKVSSNSPRPVVDLRSPVNQNVHAGEFSLLVDGQADSSFCIELTQSISLPATYSSYSLVSPDSAALGNRAFNDFQVARLGRLYQNFLGSSRVGVTESAAFQLAVWEITYDGRQSLGLGTGQFRLDTLGLSGTMAASWLNGLDALPGGNWSFQVLASPYRQDQLLARVPLPASAALLGVGFLGLGLARRIRR